MPVHLSIARYDIFTGFPPVLVTLVELALVYCADLPKFDLKSTGNKQVIDRGYNEEKKRWRLWVDPNSIPLFYKRSSIVVTLAGLLLYRGYNAK